VIETERYSVDDKDAGNGPANEQDETGFAGIANSPDSTSNPATQQHQQIEIEVVHESSETRK
jgi:hypothetical protein